MSQRIVRGIGCAVLVVAAALASGVVLAAGHGEPGPVFAVKIPIGDRTADLKTLHDLGIDVDGVYGSWVRAYVVDEEVGKLQALGFVPERLPPDDGTTLPPEQGLVASSYHTYETLTSDLQSIAAAYPNLTRLYSLGKSVQGRDLWIMKISDNPGLDEDEPEVSYIAAMHGDEVVGKEMAYDLIDYLTKNYGSDPRVTSLVDDLEIWILPSMNPDGTALHQRYNANFYDLNRNFPDQFDDPNDTTTGRQPETAAVMDWGHLHPRTVSANFHGGSLVANYPWDGTPNGASVYSICPDDSAFVSMARTYADANPSMLASNSDPAFDNGITNGADWYAINGGMQDWNYVWIGDFETTLEISTIKWPAASTLPGYWNDNLESMLRYLERAREGIRGIVTDASTGAPLAATVAIQGDPYVTRTDPDVGDYHRFVLPGLYALEVSAPGYATALVPDALAGNPAFRYDVALTPLAPKLRPVAGCVPGTTCDAWLAPGATSDLEVTLRNLGVSQTGIEGDIVPTGWYATVARATASYPDLAAGASGDSVAPHHAVTVSATAPAGHKAGFAIRWRSDQGEGLSDPFYLPVDAPTCTTVASADVPKAILDRSTAVSTLDFPSDVEISRVRVTVDIGHTYIGDLRVDIVAPSGAAVALHDRSGGSTDDIVGTYGNGLVPYEPLERLNGASSLGTWTLRVNDGVPANTGTLRGWSIEVCGRPFEATTPEMKLRDVARSGSGAILTWWPYPGMTSYRVYRSPSPGDRASFVDVTASDPSAADTTYTDPTAGTFYYLVTGVGPQGEGPR